jgi:hypothetical protein
MRHRGPERDDGARDQRLGDIEAGRDAFWQGSLLSIRGGLSRNAAGCKITR